MSEYTPELSGYTNQAQQASNHTERLVTGIGAMVMGLGGVRSAATGVAADMQQMSAGMAASARVTHQSTQMLVGDALAISRAFPLATRESLATVQAVQSLGLTAKGQERQVGALTKTVVELASATGTAAPQMARDFGALNREMGSLDPSKVSKMADVVTTLSARSGANAAGIVQFAKTISPLAQSAGVGQAAVLGMSTSFTKLGDDGYVAANAVSKMFSDLNRSVRDGSNDMAGYANAVGMTIDQFKALYQADPSRAIATVTQAVGRMPQAQAQRTLDQLGIDGIRAQRVFLNQARSGGMMADINAAEQAYGNGSTARGSQSANATVYASLTRLGNAAEQVAYAFERPLLSSVNTLVNVAGGITRGAAGVLSSGPVHGALNVASEAALPLLALRMGSRALSTGALATLIGRSGPLTGLRAGAMAGRYGSAEEALASGRGSRAVQSMLTASTYGPELMGIGHMGAVNSRFMQFGAGMGALFPRGGGGGPGLLSSAMTYGGMGAGVALRSQAEVFRLARTDPMGRQLFARPYGNEYERFAQNQMSIRGAREAGLLARDGSQITTTALRKEFSLLTESVRGAGGVFKQLVTGVGAVGLQGARFGAWGAGQIGMGIGSRLGGMLASPGGMLAAAGGVAYLGYSAYSSEQAAHRRQDARTDDLDIYGAVNEYRNAMGKVGEASMTLSDQMTAASQTVSAAVTTMSEAAKVSEQDRSAAAQNQTILNRFSGSASQVGAQVGMLNLNGLQPGDVQQAKLDLLRQQSTGALPPNFDINKALAGIPAASGGVLSSDQISAAVQGMATAPGLGHVGFGLTSIRRMHLPGEEGAMSRVGHSGSGGPQLGQAATGELSLLQGALGQERTNLSSRYGDTYGARQSLQDADKAMREALKTHNADLIVGMEQQLSEQFLGKGHSVRGLSANDIGRRGFIDILQGSGRNIAGTNYRPNDILNRGANRTLIEDSVATELQNMGSGGEGMARFFSNFASGNAGIERGRAAMTAADQAPSDLQKQHDAIMAIVDGGQRAGMSLGELAAQAARSTTAMSDQDARAAVMVGVIAEAQRRLQANLGSMTMGQRFSAQAGMASQLAGVQGNSQAAQQARQQGQDQATSVLETERGYMQQRIMVQRGFEIQSERAWRDYHTSVARANEDFQTQQAYSEQDFFRQRSRAQRDFNIQMARQVQDAAGTLYNPYTRIQAKPVWDAANLVGNEREQLAAMRQQLANIKILRGLGLDENAIQQLGLYDPDNAQQTQQLVSDLQNSHSFVGQLNRVADARVSAAGGLLSQSPTFQRSRADFARQLRDSNTDYNTAVGRQRTQFNLQMRRQSHDFSVQLGDAATDIKNADKEITGDMTTLQADMNKILHGQAVDWTNTLKSTMADTIQSIKDTTPALLAAQNAAIAHGGGGPNPSGGGMIAGPGYGTGNRKWTGTPDSVAGAQFSRAGRSAGVNAGFLMTGASRPGTDTDRMGNPDLKWGHDVLVAPDNRRLAPNAKAAQQLAGAFGWGAGPEWAALYQIWQQESGFSTTAGNISKAYGIPQAYPGSKMSSFGNDWRTNPRTQISWGLDYIAGRYGDPLGAWAHKARTGWYDSGGIAMSPHIGVVAEAGSPEAMIPLNAHGIGVLAQALRSYLSPADAAMLGGGGGTAHAIHISNDTYHYDSRMDMRGAKFEVKASSPRELEQQLREKERAQNLTAARGVNR